jgi:hypothetical protein
MTDLVGATKDHLSPVRIAALCSGPRGEDETLYWLSLPEDSLKWIHNRGQTTQHFVIEIFG